MCFWVCLHMCTCLCMRAYRFWQCNLKGQSRRFGRVGQCLNVSFPCSSPFKNSVTWSFCVFINFLRMESGSELMRKPCIERKTFAECLWAQGCKENKVNILLLSITTLMRDTGKLTNDCDELCLEHECTCSKRSFRIWGVGWEKEQRQDSYPQFQATNPYYLLMLGLNIT